MRKVMLLTLLLAVFGLAGSALAQEMPPTFCGELSEADCAIIEMSTAAQASLSSASMTLDGSIDIPDIENDTTLRIRLSGSGAYNTDMAALQSLSGLLMGSDVPTGTELSTLISNVIRAFNGDLAIKLVLPPEVVALNTSDVLDLQLRLVDGIGYVNMDTLAPLMGESGAAFRGWGGLDLAGLIDMIAAQQPEVFDMAFSSAGMSAQMELMEEFNDPARAGQYVTITRLDDQDGAAVFETTVDFAGLMNDPAYMEAIRSQMQAQMETQGMTMTDEELEMAADMSLSMFKNSVFRTTQVIDPTTGYMLSTVLYMELDLSSTFAALDGETAPAPMPFVFNLSVTMADHNTDIEISVPEGATVTPLEQLAPMMGMESST